MSEKIWLWWEDVKMGSFERAQKREILERIDLD
jgi:hypothetical protein